MVFFKFQINYMIILKYKHKSPDAQRYFYAKQGVDYTTLTIDAPSVFFRCDDAPSQSAATAGADGHVEWGAAETACLAAGDADADADRRLALRGALQIEPLDQFDHLQCRGHRAAGAVGQRPLRAKQRQNG